MRLLQADVTGRATFLVHPNDSQANFAFAEGMESAAQTEGISGIEGVVPLKRVRARPSTASASRSKLSCPNCVRASSHRTP